MSGPDRSRPPAPGTIRPFEFPLVERGRLDNGLAVISASHGTLPVVTAEIVLHAGEAASPAGKEGLAALTVRALETGTRTRSADQIAWELEQRGIQLQASADWDAAWIRMTLPGHRLDEAFALFADLARRPAFPDAEIHRLRDEQRAAILQRRKEPRALADDMAARFLFAAGTTYARPFAGTDDSVASIGSEHVAEFYRSSYRPGAAALFLVGDVRDHQARDLARRHLDDWEAASPHVPDVQVRPGPQRTTVFIVDRPGAVQSEIRVGHVGIERAHPDFFPILVMNTILGGAFTSRLNLNLRERHGFTYGASSRFDARRRPGPFLIQTAVATDVTAAATREILRELDAFREHGAEPGEVDAARDYLIGVLPLQLTTTDQLVSRLADLFVYGLPDDYFLRFPDRVAAVAPDDVNRVARQHLRPDRLAIVIVGDAASTAPALGQLDVGPVEVQ